MSPVDSIVLGFNMQEVYLRGGIADLLASHTDTDFGLV
jgi:hypothetical protein